MDEIPKRLLKMAGGLLFGNLNACPFTAVQVYVDVERKR